MSVGLLLSGGMDSIALAWWKRPGLALTIDYGQLCAEAEIRAANAVCQALGIEHQIIAVNCQSLGSGDLVGTPPSANAPVQEWWPYRNQLLVTLAGMRAITLGVKEILIATVRSDAVHADGQLDFIQHIDALMRFQEGEMRVSAPAIRMTSIDLMKTSGVPQEVLAWAHSCHRSNYACGDCRGCYKHRDTMDALGYGVY